MGGHFTTWGVAFLWHNCHCILTQGHFSIVIDASVLSLYVIHELQMNIKCNSFSYMSPCRATAFGQPVYNFT